MVTTTSARRFVLAAIGREGVVLDTRSGELYRAGATAVVVFRALGRGADLAGAAAALVRAFAVTHSRAARDVRAILASMPDRRRGMASGVRSPQFRASARGGYEMDLDGLQVAWLDERGRSVERGGGAIRCVSGADGSHVLRMLAPHVLALAGHRVLHASAVLHRDEVVAFVAPSGTGKTTLARLLARRGARAISEDLLVLRDTREAVVEGERALRTWSRSRARTVSTEVVVASVEGRAKPLRAVLILQRRKGQRGIALEPLRGADAIMGLFANAFVEVPSPRVWRQALAMCRALAARGIVYRACVPDGLPALERALPAAGPARRRSARASEADDGVEALLGIGGSDPRMAEPVTA
jgi:hypothetical protein